jgi:hypothetical protein
VRLFRSRRRGEGSTTDDPRSNLDAAADGHRNYENTVTESAVLAYVVNERPQGATVPALALALGIPRNAVSDAVGSLIRSGILRESGGMVTTFILPSED